MLVSLVRVSRRDVEKHFVRGRSWLSQPSLSLSHGGKMPPCQRAEARSQQESAPSPAQQTHPDSATPPHANRKRMALWVQPNTASLRFHFRDRKSTRLNSSH